MKKNTGITIAVTGVMILGLTVALALAAAQKVTLVPCPVNFPAGTEPPPGGGFVIFNNPRGADHDLDVTVSLKAVEPNTSYNIYVFVDGAQLNGAKAGTVDTNPRGNANFHLNGLLSKGEHVLALDVTKAGSESDVYETPGIHEGEGTLMIFQ